MGAGSVHFDDDERRIYLLGGVTLTPDAPSSGLVFYRLYLDERRTDPRTSAGPRNAPLLGPTARMGPVRSACRLDERGQTETKRDPRSAGCGGCTPSDFELVVDDSHGRFGVDTFGAGLLGIESLQRGRGSMRFPPWAAEPDALPCSSFVTRRRVRRAGGTARQRLACSLTYIVIASRMTSAARRPWAAANASTCSHCER